MLRQYKLYYNREEWGSPRKAGPTRTKIKTKAKTNQNTKQKTKTKTPTGAFRGWRGTRSGGGASAPEEVGGEAEEEENDGDGKVLELGGVEEGEDDGVADDGGGSQDEEKRGPGVAGNAVRKRLALRGATNGENGRGTESIENPANEDDTADKLGKFAGGSQDGGPNTEDDNRGGRCVEARVDFGERFEKEIVFRHGVENARGGEDDAIGGAERGDEDGECHEFAGPGTYDGGDGGGGDGVTGRGADGTKSDEIGDDGEQIESCENEGAQEKSAREGFLRIDDFAGAVGAELPAFVGPQNGDHGEAKIREQTKAVLRRAQGSGQIRGMVAEREKNGAEEDDDADFDERGPILQVGTAAGAPDVDGSDDADHQDRSDGFSCRRERDDFCEIFAEDAREGSDRAAGDDQKEAPAIEKSGHAAEGVADIAVKAAGFGVGGGKLSISERAEKREYAARKPDEERETDGAVELAKNEARGAENAGADDGADKEKEEIAKAEGADELGHRRMHHSGRWEKKPKDNAETQRAQRNRGEAARIGEARRSAEMWED